MGQGKYLGKQFHPFMTFPEVQSYLGIKSRKTILKYIRSGSLPAYKIGGTRWRIAEKDVKSFLKHHMAGNGLCDAGA